MNTTKLICWNYRGISSRDTSSRVFRIIQSHKPAVVCLVETRADSDRLDRFCRKIPKTWDWAAVLANGFSGGIIVMWHKSIGRVSPIAVSRRALHIIITDNSSNAFLISVVYNSYRICNQCYLWNELSRITLLQIPWLIVGDFNSVLHTTEHKGGPANYYERKTRFFLDFVEYNNLIDLNYTGPAFTWCNNQSGLARRWARLDRCLINLAWADFFKSNTLKHLNRAFSDHAPLFLLSSLSTSPPKKIFRFDNSWFDLIGCHNAVRDAWGLSPHGNPMQAFTHLLSRTRYNLCGWRYSGFNKVESALINLDNDINNLENSDFNTISQFLLMDRYANLSALQRQCSVKWAQRARLQWINDGDKNTSFFHALTHIRAYTNCISQVVDSSGNTCNKLPHIEQAFLHYYKNLWTTPNNTSVDILGALPTALPCLSASESDMLCREVSKDEVYRTIARLPAVSLLVLMGSTRNFT
ncbi:uncharacterized protein LOC120260105 [Dioscorea cayenensis subsp. rotundata]|uniref:Uncharacterized protein LOC120260105 n=1 Tax=Dioscorea cayennensis subsp. rotundata TaxID=55577 RepID=A0AB40B9S5_DIOCR|nr:uncharacterized protein LOC120260105 [Dioscorea cayenensis subsp. rotundata]